MNSAGLNSSHSTIYARNLTKFSDTEWKYYHPVVSSFSLNCWFAVTVVLGSFGSIATLILIGTFIANPKLRAGSGLLIVHLMFIDLVMLTVHFGLSNFVTLFAQSGYGISRTLCRNVQFWFMSTMFSRNYMAFFLAFNRFIATVVPHRYKRWSNAPVLVSMIVVCWLSGIAINLPYYFGLGAVFTSTPPLGSCNSPPTGDHKELVGLLVLLGTIVPAVLEALSYLGVFVRMKLAEAKQIPDPAASRADRQQQRLLKRRYGIAKMLFFSSLFYTVCFIPIPVMVEHFPRAFYSNPTLQLWLRTLLFCGFVGSPFILYLMNADYREGFKRLLVRVFPRCDFKLRRVAPQAPSATGWRGGTSRTATSRFLGGKSDSKF